MSSHFRFALLVACFVLSGLAGLIYETAWTQEMSLVFGTSELAVSAVLAAYMAGLMAGAAVAARWAHRVRRPVRVYAFLELGIAVTALAVPLAVRASGRLHTWVLGGFELAGEAAGLGSALFYLAVAFAILLAPTAMMGATLPLLARHAVRDPGQIGPRIGFLYAANTLGAALGTLVAAFFLLPTVGLGKTVLVAAALNGLVFVLAAWLARAPSGDGLVAESTDPDPQVPAQSDSKPAPVSWRAGGWVLPLMLASGFVALAWEVLWTRILGHLLGGSIYAFGTMLATFLLGIALGSAVAAPWARHRESARRGFVVVQLGLALVAYAAFATVDHVPGWLAGAGRVQHTFLGWSFAVAAITLLPGALFLGASFPFAVRILATDTASAGNASGRVYAWNTLGAIAGAVVTGFVLLPELRIAGTATLALAASLGIALLAALVPRPRSPRLAAVAALGLVLLALVPPETPWQVLRTAPISGRTVEGEVTFYGVGRGATVLLIDSGTGDHRLTTNGLPESSIQARGSRLGQYALARWLGLLPTLANPEIRSTLVIGLGAGITLAAIPDSVEERHLVELEPEVLRANRQMTPSRAEDPLADPRLTIHVNDARSALALSEQQFDAIVSQPSHPWTAGASHLFTLEFFELVAQHLTEDGVFVQWIGLRFVDEALLRSLVATLLEVFPQVEIFEPHPGGGICFLASKSPFDLESNLGRALELGRDQWRAMGLLTPDDLLLARWLDAEGSRRFAEGAAITRDHFNLLQTRSPRALRSPLTSAEAQRLTAELDPLRDGGDSGLYRVRRLLLQRRLERADRLGQKLVDPNARETARAMVEIARGDARRGETRLRAVARQADPAPLETLVALVHRNQRALLTGQAPWLQQQAETHPELAAMLQAWRALRLEDWKTLETLEGSLADLGPTHPLFLPATRLRIAWRHATGDSDRASEALDLLEPLLALQLPGPDLHLRAELALIAGRPEVALASLRELIHYLPRRPALRDLARVVATTVAGVDAELRRNDPGWSDLEAAVQRAVVERSGEASIQRKDSPG